MGPIQKADPRERTPALLDQAAAVGATMGIAEWGLLRARTLVDRFGADTIVLGCAGMAGHRRAIQGAIGRPVIEPTQQAAVAAIGAVLLAAA